MSRLHVNACHRRRRFRHGIAAAAQRERRQMIADVKWRACNDLESYAAEGLV